MDKYVSVAEIRADVEWLQSQGVRDLDLREVLERIELLIPAADVAEVRHGRWEKFVTASGIISRVRCSVCAGTQSLKFESMPYCPTCGARMDKEADHEVSE
jgi:hypothetical protein